jgi:hypothetical protein
MSMVWMMAGAAASWIAIAAIVPGVTASVGFGMLGPLVAVAGTWLAVDRAAKLNPARVSGVLMQLFPVKMVFFGAYVAIMIKVVGVDPKPFVASFTGYFIALYAAEAVWLRRLTRVHSASAPQVS